jgi:16S rRNA processing protein RimM
VAPDEQDRPAVPDAPAERDAPAPSDAPAPGGDASPPSGDGQAPADAPGADTPMYALGRVGKAHSLDGSFAVTKPKGELLTQGTVVMVAGVERQIVRRSGTDAKPILRVAGIDGIDAAEALRGTDLFIPRDSLPELDDDEYWPDDLVGLPVRATTGQPVGEVAEVMVLPSVDVLRVRRPNAADLLVPLHREAVPTLDVAGRDVAIDLVFLDEPAPGAGEE